MILLSLLQYNHTRLIHFQALSVFYQIQNLKNLAIYKDYFHGFANSQSPQGLACVNGPLLQQLQPVASSYIRSVVVRSSAVYLTELAAERAEMTT